VLLLRKNLFKIENKPLSREFINELRNRISCINTTNILNCEMLECVTQEFASVVEKLWYKYFKSINITKYSKAW